MAYCININHPDYLKLLSESKLSPAILKAKMAVWMVENNTTEFPTLEQLNIGPGTINATLKIIDALEKIQRGVFTKDKLQGWLNDLQKKGVSSQQLELFKEVAKPGMTKDEIASTIAANYSYTVEVNTAKSDPFYNAPEGVEGTGELEPTQYYSNLTVPGGTNYTENEIATPAITPSIKGHAQFSTDKGIGWFRSDEQIIQKTLTLNEAEQEELEYMKSVGVSEEQYLENKRKADAIRKGEPFPTVRILPTKIRRILELQSDLFQKGRDTDDLIGKTILKDDAEHDEAFNNAQAEWDEVQSIGESRFDKEYIDNLKSKIDKLKSISKASTKENQFLQLLNKNNNWVTFFVKSIIQDSAKKGYEKVLFPTGNTASKVEGHTTLEEFKKQKEDRIKELEKELPVVNNIEEALSKEDLSELAEAYNNSLSDYEKDRNKEINPNEIDSIKTWYNYDGERVQISIHNRKSLKGGIVNLIAKDAPSVKIYTSKKLNNKLISLIKQLENKENVETEINQLKQELERVEKEGFGALKPIYNFYENTVANILKKQGYSPRQVTDEYGNTWNEVEVKKEQATDAVFYQLNKKEYYKQKLKEIFFNNIYNKNLTDYDIQRIDGKLREISRDAGDVDYFVRESKAGNLYIAGYKNGNVLSDDYYSPYANGIFRQLKKTNREKRIKQLENKLLSWARAHGISVTSIKKVMAKFPERYSDNAAGIADFTKGLIALADDINIDTIPEEVGHFAVEIMLQQKDQGVIDALEQVVETAEYAQVKEDYDGIYKDEKDFRKEALGKILAAEIINQYKLSEELATPNSIWSNIVDIGTRFTNFIKSLFFNNPAAKTSLQDTVVNLANNILKQEYLGTYETVESEKTKKENDQILYQLNSTPSIVPVSALNAKEKFLKEVIKQLENRLQTFKRSAKSNLDVAQLKASIDKLIKLKEKGELDLGIYSFVNQAEEELESIENYLVKSRNNNNYNALKLNQSLSFIDMYSNILKDLSTDLYGTAEKSEELTDKLTKLHGKLNALSGLNFNMLKTAAIEVLRKGNLNPYGEPIDPNFKPEDLVEDTFEDISYWRLWAGNYKYAENSPVLKNAHKIVYDAISNTQRFTNKTANDLVALQEKFLKKYKVEDLIAKDKDGNLTHFFERDYHYDRYYKAMDELKQDIAKELEFEDYDDILVETLSLEDKKTRREMWKAFFKKHSQTVQEIDSEGNTYNVTIPAEIYRNKGFDAKMKDPVYKAYYDTIIKTKTQAIAKLPIQYRTDRLIYMLPGIRKTQAERWLGKGSFLTKLKGTLKDAFLIDEDDTQFGEISKLSNKMVPIFFTKQIELKDLTKDIAKSVTMFAEMAENFQQMNKISGDLQSILRVLAERNYVGKDKIERPGTTTKEYQALETLIDSSVFGIEQRNKLTKEIGGKEVSFNKVASRFASLIRNVNLVGNIPTIIAGLFKGSIDSVIEDQVGIYTTNESKNWSRLEFMKNMAHVIGEMGKAKQTNKMHLILQEAGTVDVNKILTESYRGRAARKLLNRDILYTGYTQADYAIKGRVTLAIYDNHRLHNGKFLTRSKFYEETAKEKNVPNDKKHQKEVQKQWEDLREKSLYNAYEVVNGNLQVKEEFKPYITDAVINSVRGKVDQVSHYVDGTMSPNDKGKLARTVLGQFLLMHRGWFIQLIDSRFKKEGVNFITDEEEIGTYKATGAMLWKMAVLTKTHGIKQALLHWQELSPARKRGVKKTVIDLVVLQLVAILAGLANKLADEDDENDWTTQYTAYQLNRILLEQGAAWNINELGQMIDEPVVGARFINSLTDINEIYSTKVYEKGQYEGWSHWRKWWYTKIPGAKNYHEFSYPEEKNKFIKQVLKSSYYEAMSDKEKHSFVSKLLTYILPSFFLSEEENEEEIYQSLASDEEYNGYN